MRRLLSHAFSESALREQEFILTHYFDLLVSRLKEQIQNPNIDKVDIMSWYNFTTFDIIGFVCLHVALIRVHQQRSIRKVKKLTHRAHSDLVLGDSFHTLENGQYHSWIRYSEMYLHASSKLINLEATYSPLSNSCLLCDSQQHTRSSIEYLNSYWRMFPLWLQNENLISFSPNRKRKVA